MTNMFEAIFNEWARRTHADESAFDYPLRTEDGELNPSYGAACAAYFQHLAEELHGKGELLQPNDVAGIRSLFALAAGWAVFKHIQGEYTGCIDAADEMALGTEEFLAYRDSFMLEFGITYPLEDGDEQDSIVPG